jgi:hypothetical protein
MTSGCLVSFCKQSRSGQCSLWADNTQRCIVYPNSSMGEACGSWTVFPRTQPFLCSTANTHKETCSWDGPSVKAYLGYDWHFLITRDTAGSNHYINIELKNRIDRRTLLQMHAERKSNKKKRTERGVVVVDALKKTTTGQQSVVLSSIHTHETDFSSYLWAYVNIWVNLIL